MPLRTGHLLGRAIGGTVALTVASDSVLRSIYHRAVYTIMTDDTAAEAFGSLIPAYLIFGMLSIIGTAAVTFVYL